MQDNKQNWQITKRKTVCAVSGGIGACGAAFFSLDIPRHRF